MSLIRKRILPPRSADWWDPAFSNRIHVQVTNGSGATLNDHLVAYDVSGVSPAVTIDANSMRVIEKTAIQGVDRVWDWRYSLECNHFLFLPAYLSGSIVRFKTLGNWNNSETRYFDLYWNQAGGISAPNFNYLDAIGNAWTVVLTRGSTGDSYVIPITSGGVTTTYTYVQLSTDTTSTLVGAGIIALINAGTVATATNASGTLSIITTTPRVFTFTVTNTGSTTPANLVITAPLYFSVGRVGPETSNVANFPNGGTNANFKFNMGLGVTSQTNAQGYAAFGKNLNTDMLVRMLAYKVNADATSYLTTTGTITGFTIDGPTITITGTLTTPTAGTHSNYWTATYTAVFSHKMVQGALSSNSTPASGPFVKTKNVQLCRLTVVWTCGTGYAPTDVAAPNVASSFILASFACKTNVFAGNATAVAPNTTTNYYATAGAGPTAYAASADLSALATTGVVLGAAGNVGASGVIIHSVTTANGFPGAPVLKWFADSNQFAYLQFNSVSHTTTTIPLGATITIDMTMASGYTPSATTAADELLPNELVQILQNVNYVPTFSPSVETYSLATLNQTIINMSNRLTAGVAWFQNSANTPGNKVNNYSFAYNPKTSTFALPDDNDGNYGESYKLDGLVLRRLRTNDPALVALIENQVRFHIDIEREAVSMYGAWWQGCAPFWYASVASTVGNIEGGYGQPLGNGNQMDPNAGSYATLTNPTAAGIAPTGTLIGNWTSGTGYVNTNWVNYTDTGGTFVGQTFWYQASGTPNTTTPPSDSSGNTAANWGNKSARQYTITYALNQVKACTSNDQIAMVGFGLYHYLQLLAADPVLGAIALPNTWYLGDIVLSATNDVTTINIGATACTYTQLGGDTIKTVATGIAAAINAAAISGVTAFASNAHVWLTGVLGITVTNTGTAHTANCPVLTERAAALALVKRMADFQVTVNPNGTTGPAKNIVAAVGNPNLYNLLTGTSTYTPTANGITTGFTNFAGNSAMPTSAYNGGTVYSGSTFGAWETTQATGGVLTSDANSGFADLIRSIYAPATSNGQTVDQTAIIYYLTGRASDIACLDLGRHAPHWNAAIAARGSINQLPLGYPLGFNLRSADGGNTYNSGVNANAFGPNAADSHWIDINGGTLDSANGRGFQRMALLAMTALFNPAASCLVEMDATASPNANVVRTALITTLLDDMARTLSLYMIEPTTQGARTCANGALGTGTYQPWSAMSTFTGYGLYASEMYLLVKQRIQNGLANNPLKTLYKFSGI